MAHVVQDWTTYVGTDQTAVMLIPKVASRSMKWVFDNKSLPDIPTQPTIAFLRDPMDRFVSGYRMHALNVRIFPARFNDYVDAVLDGFRDAHTALQTEFIEQHPVKVYPFERVDEVWAEYGFPPLPKYNAAQWPMPEIGYRADEIMQKYRPDYEARAGL